MVSKKSLDAVLDKFINLTITSPNDNANQDPVQCGGATAPKALLVPSALPTYEVRQLQDELCMAIVTIG